MLPPGRAITAGMLQILTMLDDNLAAAPDTLGDSRKETPEELAERHTRVQAGSLLALSSLIDLTAGGESGVNGRHAALGSRRAGRRLYSLINLTARGQVWHHHLPRTGVLSLGQLGCWSFTSPTDLDYLRCIWHYLRWVTCSVEPRAGQPAC